MSTDQHYTLNVFEEEALLEIVAQPKVRLADMVASQVDTERLATEKGIRKVLIDAHQMKQTPSLPEFFSFGQGLMKSPVLRTLRFALVGAPSSGLQLRFLRSVTGKLGFAVELFSSRELALEWLNE